MESRKKGTNKYIFYKSIKENGLKNFKWELLEECIVKKLIEREQFYIDKYYLDKNGKFIKVEDIMFVQKQEYVRI